MTSNFAELHSDAEQLGFVSEFVDEFIEAVQTQPEFRAFSRQETALLSEYLECYGVPRDSVVVREGDEGDFLAILVTGKAVILKTHEGEDKVVAELAPGEMFGEMSLVDGQPRFAGCVTTEPSDFAVLSNQSLHALLADHPRLGNKFLMMLLAVSTARLRTATKLALPGYLNVSI
jgi:CRP-like cAMP-binding protein